MERLFELTDENKERICRESASKLRTLRVMLGWNISDFAELLGTTGRRLSEIERGRREMPWSLFMSLLPMFALNPRTRNSEILRSIIDDELVTVLSGGWHDRDRLFELLSQSERLTHRF